MNIHGAIFDMDGTLLDSMRIWRTLGADFLRSCGIEPREDLHETFKNMSLRQAACYYQEVYGLPCSTEDIISGVNDMITRFYTEEALPKEGVLEALELLRSRGVAMCVATATDRHLAQAALKRNGLLDFFQEIFTCSGVGHGKDEPHIYEAALECLGTPKEHTWVFEDALYAVNTAKSAGFPVVGVYDQWEKSNPEVAKAADLFIHQFHELRGHLDAHCSDHRGV